MKKGIKITVSILLLTLPAITSLAFSEKFTLDDAPLDSLVPPSPL